MDRRDWEGLNIAIVSIPFIVSSRKLLSSSTLNPIYWTNLVREDTNKVFQFALLSKVQRLRTLHESQNEPICRIGKITVVLFALYGTRRLSDEQ